MDKPVIETIQIGDLKKSELNIGDLKLSIDTESVDKFIDRIERAIVAFKQEWNRVPDSSEKA